MDGRANLKSLIVPKMDSVCISKKLKLQWVDNNQIC